MNTKFLSYTLGALSLTTSVLAQNQKPNIIFILTDDLGYGDVGVFYQNHLASLNDKSQPVAFTPKIDAMAHQGVQFRDQYCSAPVSVSSRASLLTGLSQGNANIRDNQFDKELADNHTIATVLKTAGYNTSIIGKWGVQGKTENLPYWPAHPNKRGFEYFYGYIKHKDGHEHYPKEGIYDGPKEVYENYNEVSAGLDKCYTADLWTAAAKKWIIEQESTKNKKPFFMYLAYDTPHAVLELPTQAYPDGGGLTGGLQWIGKPGKMINTASGVVDSWIHPDYANATYDDDKNPQTPEVPWPNVYKRYATDTRRIDDAVGDLLQLLKDLKIDKNTLVIFASDNGPSIESYLPEEYKPTFFKSYGPFEGIKRDCLDGGTRVPVVAWWPGTIPAGKIVETPSISYDWLATFAQISNIPAPANTNGVSLLPSLTGKGTQQKGLVYIEYFLNVGNTPDFPEFAASHRNKIRKQMQMIRLGNLVGLRYNIESHSDKFEIYNIKDDPREITDLSSKPGMDKIQQQMKDKVLQSRRPDTSAPRPYDNELIPAIKVNDLKSGVNWEFFSGDFPWVPNVSLMKPEKSGLTKTINLNFMPNKWVGAIVFDGYLAIPQDGEYSFSLTSDTGAFLRIHDCNVIDMDYGYIPGTTGKGKILLKKGLHPFKLSYLHKTNKPMLQFIWSGPGIQDQKISETNLFYSTTK